MFRKTLTALTAILIITLIGCSVNTSIHNDMISRTMKTLTSSSFRGRLTGTDGNERAAGYIAENFNSIGLEPYDGRSYYHHYSQEIFNPDKQVHKFSAELNDGTTHEYIYGDDYIAPLNIGKVSITAPVTSVIDDAQGKVLLIDSSKYADGIIVRPMCLLKKTKSFFYTVLSNTNPVTISISEKMFNDLNRKDIKTVNINMESVQERVDVKNVVGKIPGNDHKKALIISAHFDHMGWAGKRLFPGAVDNASGIAVMLDLACKLKQQSSRKNFSQDIIFCGFNGEEFSLKGSSAFADEIKSRYDDVSIINIDSAGKKDGGKLIVDDKEKINTELAHELSKFLISNNIDIDSSGDIHPGTSDHAPFNQRNIPGITLGQSNMEGPCSIHTPMDTLNNIDYTYLDKLSKAVFEFIAANDGVVFKKPGKLKNKPADIYNPLSQPDNETKEKALKIYTDEQNELKYDEYKYFSLNGFKFLVLNNKPLNDINDIKKYYPYMNIPDKIDNFTFHDAVIQENTIPILSSQSPGDAEAEKIYKRDLSSENIVYTCLNYINNNKQLSLEIFYEYDFSPEFEYFNYNNIVEFDKEEIEIDGVKHYIVKSKGNNMLAGYCDYVNADTGMYRAGIFLSRIDNNGNPSYDNNREELINIMKQADTEEIINKLGI